MAYAREIFIAIKQKIRFQQADKEADSHYTVLGNTLVRISNHCTWMKIWDNYLQKNPQDAIRNILSLVFEDGEDTYTEECLFTVTERKKPIRVTEYVFKSASLSKQDVKMIIGSLQQMMTTNKFNEPTGKGERFDRISVNPDYMNIETTADRRAIPAGGHGMDYSIEESKTNKNMKKNVVKINENTLRQIVAESVKKVLKETELDYDMDNFSGRWSRGPRYNIYIGDTLMYRDVPEETADRVWDEVCRKAEMWGEEPRCEEI